MASWTPLSGTIFITVLIFCLFIAPIILEKLINSKSNKNGGDNETKD